MKFVLRKLLDHLDWSKVRHTENAKAEPPQLTNDLPEKEEKSSSQDITHAWFWPRMGQWLQPNDLIITETQVLLVPQSYTRNILSSQRKLI